MNQHASSERAEGELDGRRIVRIALLGEGLLVFISLPWFWLVPERALSGWSWWSIALGAAAALPLLAISFGLSLLIERTHLRHSIAGRRILEFQEQVIRPLCAALSARQAAVVALASGVGEELLFRGALTAILHSLLPFPLVLCFVNLFFSVIHFIGRVRYFAPLIPLYFFAGLVFSLLFELSGSILAPITAHAVFNFVSILLNRRFAGRAAPREAQTPIQFADEDGEKAHNP